MKYCTGCGTEIKPGSKFCTTCGMRIPEVKKQEPLPQDDIVEAPQDPETKDSVAIDIPAEANVNAESNESTAQNELVEFKTENQLEQEERLVEPVKSEEKPQNQPLKNEPVQEAVPVHKSVDAAESVVIRPIGAAAEGDTTASKPHKVNKERGLTGLIARVDRNFWLLYIIFGACSLLFIRLGGLFGSAIEVSDFGIVMTIFGIVCGFIFAALGLERKMWSLKLSDDQSEAHRTKANVCFGLSIVVFVFVLLGGIANFFIISQTVDTMIGMIGLKFGA